MLENNNKSDSYGDKNDGNIYVQSTQLLYYTCYYYGLNILFWQHDNDGQFLSVINKKTNTATQHDIHVHGLTIITIKKKSMWRNSGK